MQIIFPFKQIPYNDEILFNKFRYTINLYNSPFIIYEAEVISTEDKDARSLFNRFFALTISRDNEFSSWGSMNQNKEFKLKPILDCRYCKSILFEVYRLPTFPEDIKVFSFDNFYISLKITIFGDFDKF